jgi:hypothetical protein
MSLTQTLVSSRRRMAAVLATASVFAFASPAQADNFNPVIAGGFGAAAGAIIGHSIGGRDGAIVGGAIGGATGVAIGSDMARRGPPFYPNTRPPVYAPPVYGQHVYAPRVYAPPLYAPPLQAIAYYPPPRFVQQIRVERHPYWRGEHRHGRDFGRSYNGRGYDFDRHGDGR